MFYTVIAAVVATTLVGIIFGYTSLQDTDPLNEPRTQTDMQGTTTLLPDKVNIGVMLPATGDLASHGQDSHIAVNLAGSDFNNYLESKDAHWRIDLIVEDTQTDPIVALEKIQSLNSKGVNLILGTQTSAELQNIMSYAHSNDILMISPSSTSPKLAMPDNVFRLIPDDTKQGVVIAKILQDSDIKVAIPIYRADVWGDGLYASSKESFEALGGIVDGGIRYSPEITVFSTEANLLSETTKRYMADGYDADEIAVLMMSFSEAVHLLNSAASYDALGDVAWFGSDASSNDDAITDDPMASRFAQDVNFISTQFAASENAKYRHVHDHLMSEIGSSPNNYAYSSYDSLWVLGLTIEETGSVDTSAIISSLPSVAEKYTGAVGNIILNEAGDLDSGDYELWAIIDGQWESVGKYVAATDTLEFN